MNRAELIKQLKDVLRRCSGAEKTKCRAIIKTIEEQSGLLPANFDYNTLPNIDEIMRDIDSLISSGREKGLTDILTKIQNILIQIQKKVIGRRDEIVRDCEVDNKKAIEILDKNRKGLTVFVLIILGLVAASTIVCLVVDCLQDAKLQNGWDMALKILTTLDVPIGVLGFIWERLSDMRNKEQKAELHSQLDKVKEVENNNEFIKEAATLKTKQTKINIMFSIFGSQINNE